MAPSGKSIDIYRLASGMLDQQANKSPADRLALYQALRDSLVNQASGEQERKILLDRLGKAVLRLQTERGYDEDLTGLFGKNYKDRFADPYAGQPVIDGADYDHGAQGIDGRRLQIYRPGKSRGLLARLGGIWRKLVAGRKGPPAGAADQEPSDYVHLEIDVELEGAPLVCRYSYGFDPACRLAFSIESPEGTAGTLFAFSTRSYSLKYAFAELGDALEEAGFSVPSAGLKQEAEWISEARDCDEVRVASSPVAVHPCVFVSALASGAGKTLSARL